MEISWKINGIFKADAQKVYKEIGDTCITPEEVLEKARNKKSELHKCFEWDDSVAAEKYRLEQARTVIRMLVIKTEDKEEQPQRVFQISSQKNEYQPIKFFMQNKDEYQKLLERAKDELKAFKNRYKSLSELEEVFDAIDNL